MKVAITGVTGAVAPFVVAELQKEHELTLFARRPVETKHGVVVGDLTLADDCQRALEGIEGVIHLGGISEPAPKAFHVNTCGTYNLMEAARAQGVSRVVMASTNCVYGHCFQVSNRPFPLEFLPIDETHPCRPEDNYGISKKLDEEMLAIYSHTWGIHTAAMRLNWVWGPKEIDWWTETPEKELERFALYFWAYVDARDAARAFRLALEAPELPGHGVYNISAADTMADEDSLELANRFYPGVKMNSKPTWLLVINLNTLGGTDGRARESRPSWLWQRVTAWLVAPPHSRGCSRGD
jgi:UDP-glucose 4-epimerase